MRRWGKSCSSERSPYHFAELCRSRRGESIKCRSAAGARRHRFNRSAALFNIGGCKGLQTIRHEWAEVLFQKVADIKPTIDIIIHNAAIAEFKPISEVTEDDWDRHFNLNAKGSFFVLQGAAKIVANGGRIIAISSTGTKAAVPGGSVYFGTKGALEQVLLSFLERAHL